MPAEGGLNSKKDVDPVGVSEEDDDALVVKWDMSFESDRAKSNRSVVGEGDNATAQGPPKVILSDASIDYDEAEMEIPGDGESVSEATETTLPAGDATLKSNSGIKMELLSYVASLDRGIVAFPTQQREVERLSAALEATASGGVVDPGSDTSASMPLLSGRWRLVYSSGFGSGSLGGRQPGPPASVVPFSIGQVYQDIDVDNKRLDNVVQLCFRAPAIPFLQQADPEPLVAEITLGHGYEVSQPAAVTITFDSTEAKFSGPAPFPSDLPSFAVPQLPEALQPPRGLRSATFDVTFLDEDMRVTRGDRGELRVYVRA